MIIAKEHRNLQTAKGNRGIEEELSFNAKKVIAIDSMAIVNKSNIANSQISNYDDFAKCFTDMITNETEDCDKCYVVYDRYDPQSLKNNTRYNRKKELSTVHYKVSDTTRI